MISGVVVSGNGQTHKCTFLLQDVVVMQDEDGGQGGDMCRILYGHRTVRMTRNVFCYLLSKLAGVRLPG